MGLNNYIMKIFTIIILCLLISCDMFFGKDDKLTLQKQNNISDKLKLNGYYYCPYSNDEYLTTYFLNSNGILLYSGSFKTDKLEEYQLKWSNNEFNFKDVKYWWGVYQIKNDSIFYERWYPSEKPYKVKLKRGIILNDTTFQITSVEQNGNKKRINETFYFKKFISKPDSITKFIK